MRKYILLIVLILPLAGLINGQIINSKSGLSLSAGRVLFGAADNIFFPKGISDNGLSFRVDYLHTILPWLKIGVEGSMVLPGATGSFGGGFANIEATNEKIITAGLNGTFFLPFRESGWRNRFRFQLGVAPVLVAHSGQRKVTINNTVWNAGTNQFEMAVIQMNGTSGAGLSLTPAVEYSLNQRIGFRLSWNSLFTSLKSELTTEQTRLNSINLGIFLPLSRSKQFNY